jgi:hypothetical protein
VTVYEIKGVYIRQSLKCCIYTKSLDNVWNILTCVLATLDLLDAHINF